jgi:hypothetical protein
MSSKESWTRLRKEQVVNFKAANYLDCFIQKIKPSYQVQFFHRYIIDRLEAFEQGKIKKLMVFMPPQHGKSELTTRLFPAYLLGKRPERKIAIASYSATIAHEFARDVKNYINSPEYREVFPKTVIGRSSEIEGSYSDSSYYYHTAPYKGFVYAVGRGGSITSKTIDIGIIDDPLKGREEAMSLTIKEKLWKWFIDDYRTRLHNDSQELLIQTRWDKDDLGGRLLREESDWEVIVFPAIKTKNHSDYDPRQEGEALWPEKHSLERILEQKKKSEFTFNSLYQQEPKPDESVMVHPHFVAVKDFPWESIERWVVGLDYGYTADPTAIVAVGVWGNKRYWRTLGYETAIPAEKIKAVLEKEGLDKGAIYSEHDPDMVSALRRLQLGVRLANKSVYAGILAVNEYENYYLETDKYLHNEVINYQFQTVGDIVLNDPVDGNDHILNAGRYAIYTDKYANKGK